MHKISEVLRLHFIEALSIRKIAVATGVPRGTISDYLTRTRRAGLSWSRIQDLDDDALELALFSHPERSMSPHVYSGECGHRFWWEGGHPF